MIEAMQHQATFGVLREQLGADYAALGIMEVRRSLQIVVATAALATQGDGCYASKRSSSVRHEQNGSSLPGDGWTRETVVDAIHPRWSPQQRALKLARIGLPSPGSRLAAAVAAVEELSMNSSEPCERAMRPITARLSCHSIYLSA